TTNPETARRLQGATRRRILAAKIPQRTAQPRHAAHPSTARDHAQRQDEVGPSAVIITWQPINSLATVANAASCPTAARSLVPFRRQRHAVFEFFHQRGAPCARSCPQTY